MKKIIALILSLAVMLAMAAVVSFAEEGEGELDGPDETTFRVYTYDPTVAWAPSIWFNTFDPDGECTGTDFAIFNSAAPVKAVGFPELYAGISANGADCTVRFEIFKWDTDAAKTVSGTPVVSKDIYFDGDVKNLHIPFDAPAPAGQYLFRVTQLTGIGDEDQRPYSVLPISDLKFSASKLEFDARGPFVFYVDCEKKEGLTDYFLNLEGKESEIEILPEKTVIPRNNIGVHPIFDYGIVTPEVPAGQVLYSFALIESPTWMNTNGDSDVIYEVYKWTGDYEESYRARPIASGEILNHADNSNLTLTFGTALRYGHRYLIVITRSNEGAIGYYEGVMPVPDGWEFYEYGEQVFDYCAAIKVAYANVGDLGPEATDEPPAEQPTEAPVENPTEAPVENETQQPAEQPTEAPVEKPTDKPAEKPGKKGCGGTVAGGSLAVLALAAFAFISRKKR